MKKSYFVSPIKLAVSSVTTLASFCITIVQLILHEPVGAIVFSLIGFLFLAVAFINGSCVTIDPDGIQLHFLSFCRKSVKWEDIQEVGVIGTQIFLRHPESTGSRYIYFSPEVLNDEKRFRLALEWPPKKIIYFQYTKENLQDVQLLWKKSIANYQAGELYF